MNKETVLEIFLQTVEESSEWAYDSETGYANYISGLTDMTRKMLNYIEENDKNKENTLGD